jgi:hypothetical protein
MAPLLPFGVGDVKRGLAVREQQGFEIPSGVEDVDDRNLIVIDPVKN